MSSTAPKIDWLVIVPDHEGVLEKRMAVRPNHLQALTKAVEEGFWKVGGATLAAPPKEGEGLQITGSAMMAQAATKEEVIEALKKDVYAKEVWDFSKIQIYPMKVAFRKE